MGPVPLWEKSTFKRIKPLLFFLHHHLHADEGILLLQGDDVLVVEADAALTGTTGDGVLIVGATMNAYAGEAWSLQPQEPVAVGQDGTATIPEIVPPLAGVINLGNLETG